MILGLDCGLLTGWCLWKDGKVYESGTMDFTKRRGESNGSVFLRFRHWLVSILSQEIDGISFVGYEQSHHRGGAATEIGTNLTGRVQEVCAEYKIEYASVHTGTLKKFATGRGDASKENMMAFATQILLRAPIDDNEADAVLIAKWAAENYG